MSQNLESAAGMFRIRIRCADNHAFDFRRDDGFRARRRAAVRAAGFERHVKRRAFRRISALLRIAKRLDFRVWFARVPVPAASDDFAALHQHRADHRIGRSRAVAAPGEADGLSHVIQIFLRKEFLARVHCKRESTLKQTHLPQQEVFIERVVISDLNFRIRVKDILDGNLLRNYQSEIGGQISRGVPFQ